MSESYDLSLSLEACDELDGFPGARARRSAFADVYRAHHGAIATHVLRRTGDPELTSDLVAEVFLRAFERYEDFDPNGPSIHHWLLRIATNVVNQWARRRRVRAIERTSEDLEALAMASETREGPERDADREHVQQALLRLAPRHQSVLSLHYLEELSVHEIASVLACRVGTVKSRLSRGRRELRKWLERNEKS